MLSRHSALHCPWAAARLGPTIQPDSNLPPPQWIPPLPLSELTEPFGEENFSSKEEGRDQARAHWGSTASLQPHRTTPEEKRPTLSTVTKTTDGMEE